MTITRTGGGTFDPNGPSMYFIASNMERLGYGARGHDNLLVAINEVRPTGYPTIEGWLESGKKLFIDSGIFNLTNTHAREHGIPMDKALGLAPDQVDGFGELWERYREIVTRYADRVWGYIELDQGGRENKIKTRAKLEALGLRPIPVYHPFNDGWEYFDYLAERYDRICFGNIVQADVSTRKRLIATAWERHRKYPHLWIHLLGYTPNQHLYGMPINSGDSSSWLEGVRWAGGQTEKACGQTITDLPRNFRYILGSDANSGVGQNHATALAGYVAHGVGRNWNHYLSEMEAMGWQKYPAPTSEPSPGSSANSRPTSP